MEWICVASDLVCCVASSGLSKYSWPLWLANTMIDALELSGYSFPPSHYTAHFSGTPIHQRHSTHTLQVTGANEIGRFARLVL